LPKSSYTSFLKLSNSPDEKGLHYVDKGLFFVICIGNKEPVLCKGKLKLACIGGTLGLT
jgi:hypothetical protein